MNKQIWKSIRSYEDADTFIKPARHSRTIYHYLKIKRDWFDDCIYVVYRGTKIVTFWQNGKIEIFANGWQSKTTKKYINMFANVNIYQRDFVWYWQNEVYDLNKRYIVKDMATLLPYPPNF